MAKAPATTQTAVATVSGSAVASKDLMNEFEGVGTGLENVTAADLLIPRLTILQGLSPQVVRTKPEYDENARVGDIYDVGLQERFPDGIHIIPVHYVKQFLEWAPRSSGKGLVAIHDSAAILDKTTRNDRNQPMLGQNLIQETAQFYCLNISAQNRKSFIPMASTQLKKGKRLLTLATSEKLINGAGKEFTPPLFYRTYKLTTVGEQNAEGDWMGWKIERDVALDALPNWQNIMTDIKAFRDALTKGDIVGDIAAMAEEAGQTIDHENGAM